MSDRYESSSSVGEVKSPKIIKTEASQTYVFICLEQQIDQQQQQGGTGQDASQQRERQNSSPALSSGYDSAIGGSSPSSYNASSTSGGIGGADWQFSGVKLGHFIASLDEEGNTFGAKRKPAFVELDSENVAEELQKVYILYILRF
jgi:hypothetical protein